MEATHIIHNKTVLLSLLAYENNHVIDKRRDDYNESLSITLLRLADGVFAVCDNLHEETYVTYLYEHQDAARDAYEQLMAIA
jgi:hypothetical protein